MLKFKECRRQNTCLDCTDEKCIFVGSKEAECPKWQCNNNHDCDNCSFIDEYIEEERKYYDKRKSN